jgi:EAL domain-containing protein (putative c-di-GMP-specific phosphodiesterase class I)
VPTRKLEWTFDGEELAPASLRETSTRALTRADIDVVFQPIVALGTGAVYGIEVLVRCRKPALRNPEVLFDRAVKDRSAGYVGRLIRDVAFERCDAQTVFVNLHPAELSSRWLVRPDDPLNYHRGAVFLEITESAAFQYFDLCKGALAEVCSRAGALLVIDDFGAGYSNLKRIIDLEPAIVKLDRGLIAGIDMNRRQQRLVKYVVQLCKGLGARVVAEGIETIEELKALRDR